MFDWLKKKLKRPASTMEGPPSSSLAAFDYLARHADGEVSLAELAKKLRKGWSNLHEDDRIAIGRVWPEIASSGDV